MSLDNSSPPPAKQAKLGSTCEIKDMSDADLAEIFKHLPPLDRLFISAVRKRWNGISRAVWADVTHLDLSLIPGRQIAPIVSQCPNLNSIVALNKIFALGELYILTHIKLHSLKLYNCEATILAFEPTICDAFSRVFSSHLRSASWQEFVLHNFLVNIVELDTGKPIVTVDIPASLPTALKRLQISGLLQFKHGSDGCGFFARMRGLEGLQNLECLTVSLLPYDVYSCHAYRLSTGQLEGLRELYLGRRKTISPWAVIAGLTRLEVLFLDQVDFMSFDDYAPLVTNHPTLRIIVLTGDFREEVTLPKRRRYPNGFSALPVPTLHVFVGKSASEKIRFAMSSIDTLKIFPISEPLPQFLDRADIAPIFDGVWLAENIKEAAKHSAHLCDYQFDVTSTIHHANA